MARHDTFFARSAAGPRTLAPRRHARARAIAALLAGLSAQALACTAARVAQLRDERARLQAALAALPDVRRVYRSEGNYLLVRFVDADAAFARLLAAGVVVRDQRAAPQLGDALRISIGTPEQNQRVLAALDAKDASA